MPFGLRDLLLTGLSGGLNLVYPAVQDLKARVQGNQVQGLLDRIGYHPPPAGGVPPAQPGQPAPAPAPAPAQAGAPAGLSGMLSPQQRQQFAMGLLGIPGMQGIGGQMLMQQGQPGTQGYHGYKNFGSYATQAAQQNKTFQTQMLPYRTALGYFDNATKLVTDRGGWASLSGADDQALIKSAQKLILASEAVMSDDQRTALDNSGFQSKLETMKNQLISKKGAGLGPEARMYVYQMMKSLRTQVAANADYVAANATNLAKSTRIDPHAVVMRRKYLPIYQGDHPTSTGQRGIKLGRTR